MVPFSPATQAPRRPLFVFAVMLTLTLCGQGHAASLDLHYWNDTVDLGRFVREGRTLAQDDYVTVAMSVTVRSATELTSPAWRAGLLAVTLKDWGQRTDLLYAAADLPVLVNPRYQLSATVGLLANGRFGGSGLQNGWHAVRRHSIVDLRYPSSPRYGPLLGAALTLPVLENATATAALLLRSTHAPTTGYHREDVHLHATLQVSSRLHLAALAGYSGYHDLHASIRPAFESGPVYGGELALAVYNGMTASVWIYSGLYRNDQSAQGFTLRLRPGSLTPQAFNHHLPDP